MFPLFFFSNWSAFTTTDDISYHYRFWNIFALSHLFPSEKASLCLQNAHVCISFRSRSPRLSCQPYTGNWKHVWAEILRSCFGTNHAQIDPTWTNNVSVGLARFRANIRVALFLCLSLFPFLVSSFLCTSPLPVSDDISENVRISFLMNGWRLTHLSWSVRKPCVGDLLGGESHENRSRHRLAAVLMNTIYKLKQEAEHVGENQGRHSKQKSNQSTIEWWS